MYLSINLFTYSFINSLIYFFVQMNKQIHLGVWIKVSHPSLDRLLTPALEFLRISVFSVRTCWRTVKRVMNSNLPTSLYCLAFNTTKITVFS